MLITLQVVPEMTHCIAMVPTIRSEVEADQIIFGVDVEMIHVTMMNT